MRLTVFRLLLAALFFSILPTLAAGGGHAVEPASFPIPLDEYEKVEDASIFQQMGARIAADPFNLAATIIFILAILHTFMAGFFNKLAHEAEHEHEKVIEKLGLTATAKPQDDAKDHVSFKATLYHFLGEVEAIFGIWVIALGAAATYFHGWGEFKSYISTRNYTEPMFVVIIMAIAASRPVLKFSENVMAIAAKLGNSSPAAWWVSVMTIAPILGSFITEPAAMTIGALLLAKKFYKHNPKPVMAYATLGLLFVNVSIGGTLTHFAAPPVLMVAGVWDWGMGFMATHFGYKAVIAIFISNALYFYIFRKEMFRINDAADGREDGVLHALAWHDREDKVPTWVTVIHLFFLAWTVYAAHDPALFIGGFLFFLAFTMATEHHQNQISMKTPLLVGFFLAGLIIHGGCQGWWIEPIILALPGKALMFGSTVLTAFNDNAAITFLASQVQGITDAQKYAVVAGAVTGGGLTVIANAPNPAGMSILGKFFDGGVSPLKLVLGALIPTIIAYGAFSVLPDPGMKSASIEAEAAPTTTGEDTAPTKADDSTH